MLIDPLTGLPLLQDYHYQVYIQFIWTKGVDPYSSRIPFFV
jgi:hypothetical protein